MKLLYCLFYILVSVSCYSQSTNKDNTLFFENILFHQKKFTYDLEKAYLSQKFDTVNVLFKDFINTQLIGKQMNDFKWSRFKSKHKSLYEIKTPIYLLTRSSWCLPSKGEIPALVQLARKYKNEVTFVVLFWDKKANMKKEGRKYSKHIDVVYIDESSNKNDYTIKALKHVLGVPTIYLLDKNKKVKHISRPVSTPFHYLPKESFKICRDQIQKQLRAIIN